MSMFHLGMVNEIVQLLIHLLCCLVLGHIWNEHDFLSPTNQSSNNQIITFKVQSWYESLQPS